MRMVSRHLSKFKILLAIIPISIFFSTIILSEQSPRFADASTPLNLSWTKQLADPALSGTSGVGLTSISCIQSECFAADDSGRLVYSTNATSSSIQNSTWAVIGLDSGSSFNSITCPSTSFCVAASSNGSIYYSSSPTTFSYIQVPIDPTSSIESLSCPSINLCVGGDANGNIVYSTTPASSSWTVQNVDSTNAILAISCPSINLCVGGDANGNIVYSTTPTSTTSNFLTALNDSGNSILSVSCLSSDFCLAGDSLGNVIYSSSPSSTSWTKYSIDGFLKLDAISCISTSSCIFVDNLGNALASSTPFVSSPWTSITIDSSVTITSMSCYSPMACIASDSAGNILFSSSPTQSNWTVENIDGTNSIKTVTCPSPILCLAGDNSGNIFVSSSPYLKSSWVEYNIDGSLSIQGISCPTTSICYGVDSSGNLITISNPQAPSFSIIYIETLYPTHPLTDISCPTTALCVVGDSTGDIFYSSDLTAGSSNTWTFKNVDGANEINSVTCPTSSFCIFADSTGNIFSAQNFPSGSFTSSAVAPGTSIDRVKCNTELLCIASQGNGSIATSQVTIGTNPTWTSSQIDGNVPLDAVSCPSINLCLVGDSAGQILTGIGTPLGLGFTPITPTRVCDTRIGSLIPPNGCNNNGNNPGTLNNSSLLDVPLSAYVPSSAQAVLVNITVTNTTVDNDFVDLTEGGANKVPSISTVNIGSSQTVAEIATVTLGPSKDIQVFNMYGQADIIIDLAGYFSPLASSVYNFGFINPERICDTRIGSNVSPNQCNKNGTLSSPLSPDSTLSVSASQVPGIPSNASGLVANITATNATQEGDYLTVFQSGTPKPPSSNLNIGSQQTVSNTVILPYSLAQDISIYNFIGTVDVIVDVVGYITLSTQSTFAFVPATPERICDTRLNAWTPNECNNFEQTSGELNPLSTLDVQATGEGDIPSSQVGGLFYSLIATNGSSNGGFFSVSPSSTSISTSVVNFAANTSVAHASITGLSSSGTFNITNAIGSADAIVDVEGWFTPI